MASETEDVSTAAGDKGQTKSTSDIANSESQTPLKTPTKETEVKFIVNDSMNGGAKIDIEHVRTAFSGMTKDELLQYVNDPFWVRMRMFLFILFWLLWILMFAAAIAIIFVAPRCQAPAPKKWFQEGPIYDANAKAFIGENGLSTMADKLDYLKDIKVKGLILSSVIESDEKGDIKDFKSLNPNLGTVDQLKSFLEKAKEKAIRILLDFIPNHSGIQHDWFNKSAAKIAPYDNYYVWASSSGTAPDGSRKPPNNWKSVTGGSAWTYNEARGEFYLHQFDVNQPDLNFHNERIREEFTNILTYWLDLGFSGFSLDRVQYLLEDPKLEDERIGEIVGTTHEVYDFYMHGRTYNLPGTDEILSQWRNLTANKTNSDGLFVVEGEVPIPSDMSSPTRVVDLARKKPITSNLTSAVSASDLVKRLKFQMSDPQIWPGVQAGGPNARVVDVLGPTAVDPLNMITLLMPGTPITYFGEELGLPGSSADSFPWNTIKEDSDGHLALYKTLAGMRDSPSILYGAMNVTALDETLIFARWKAGNPGFVAVYNLSPSNVTADLTLFTQFPPDLTVFAVGAGSGNLLKANARVPINAVSLEPQSAVVFTFVPTV